MRSGVAALSKYSFDSLLCSFHLDRASQFRFNPPPATLGVCISCGASQDRHESWTPRMEPKECQNLTVTYILFGTVMYSFLSRVSPVVFIHHHHVALETLAVHLGVVVIVSSTYSDDRAKRSRSHRYFSNLGEPHITLVSHDTFSGGRLDAQTHVLPHESELSKRASGTSSIPPATITPCTYRSCLSILADLSTRRSLHDRRSTEKWVHHSNSLPTFSRVSCEWS